METAPKKNPWSAQRIVLELMAIWFGSVHAVAIVSHLIDHDESTESSIDIFEDCDLRS